MQLLSMHPQLHMHTHSCAHRPTSARNVYAVEEGDHVSLYNAFRMHEKYGGQGWCHKMSLNPFSLKRAADIKARPRQIPPQY